MTTGDAEQRAYVGDNMTRIHHDIETMTRHLELEKRRLQRTETELAAARRTYQVKVQRLPAVDQSVKEKDMSSPEGRHERRYSTPTAASSRAAARASIRASRAAAQMQAEVIGSDVQPCESPVSMGGAKVVSASNHVAMAHVPLRALLNRLDEHRKTLDLANYDNAALRSEVDTLRRRRLQLDGVFERLKQDIHLRSTQLQDFLEERSTSQAVQHDAQQRVGVVRRHRDLERKHFKHEVLRLREELRLRDWERKELEVQLLKAQTGVQKKKELLVPEEESGFSEGDMMRRIMKTAFLNCIQRRHIRQHQKNIQVFEQAFATIKQNTGIEHIEEIVNIFVHLESRNYSLLTYVNHMNKEIESLEAARREKRQKQMAREKWEEHHAQIRQEALSDIQRQLQAAQFAIHESHGSYTRHQELLGTIRPLLLETAHRIYKELEVLKKPGHWTGLDDILIVPGEMAEETLPEWLKWVETALGRFRDLLPGTTGEREGAFPCTVLNQVKQLPSKRLGGHAPPQLLVKPQELPSAIQLSNDRAEGASHTFAHSHTHRAEMLDDDEEDDFSERPMALKDLRFRAEQACSKRKRRGNKRDGLLSTLSSSVPAHLRRTATTDQMDKTYSEKTDTPSETRNKMLHHSDTYSKNLGVTRGSVPHAGEACRGQNDENQDVSTRLASEVSFEGKEQQSMDQDSFVNDETSVERGSLVNGGIAAVQRPRKLLKRSEEDDELPAVTDEELSNTFLKRYKMTKDELHAMADRLNIHLSNLFFLKQEFDSYDQDQSGCIDAREVKGLLKRLGEDASDHYLDQVFRALDSDGSGEIEFFEFAEWFTSMD